MRMHALFLPAVALAASLSHVPRAHISPRPPTSFYLLRLGLVRQGTLIHGRIITNKHHGHTADNHSLCDALILRRNKNALRKDCPLQCTG